MQYTLPFITLLIGFAVGWLARGSIKAQVTMLNEFAKRASKREYVPDTIAPGENAQVVEYDITLYNLLKGPDHERQCQGCRYSGRYVI